MRAFLRFWRAFGDLPNIAPRGRTAAQGRMIRCGRERARMGDGERIRGHFMAVGGDIRAALERYGREARKG